MRPAWWRAATGAAVLAPWFLLVISCTRMPTAPRFPVTLQGVVTGPAREPLPGISLSFHSDEQGHEDYGFAVTDSRGAYSVLLHRGTYQVRVEGLYRGFLTRYDRISVSERHARVDFAFLGVWVTGRVLDPTGVALDSGFVFARQTDERYALSSFRQGTYSLLLPAGTYSLAAGPADYWSGLPSKVWDSVPIESDTTIDLRLEGIPVSGTVLGPDGSPMSEVRVRADAQNAPSVANQTRADGSYRLYLPSATYTFRFHPPYPFYIIPRIIGPQTIGTPVSIDCDLSGVDWSGTIRRSDTNQPVPGITVIVAMLDDPDGRGAAISNGAQGEFRFVMEQNRRYDLRAYDPGTDQEVARVPGLTATVDTTFEILVPPVPAPL